jgi:DNA-directed RNA polymerase subunit alpha
MENIFLPSKIEIKTTKNPNEGILTVEPLYHGYGTTLGNALRRVLLSSLPGAAVTSFKIKGTTHEFSTIEGIYEDVLELSLNLKELRLKVHSDEPVTLKLTKKGEGDVLGKDIAKDSNVEIINGDLKIATITDKKKELEIEITVEKGRGFVTTEKRDESEKLPVGTIAIDAIFTPIKDVGYKVEDTRVGQITDYDKLIVTIETDGTITPEQAISDSSKLLNDHFSLLYKEEPVKEVKEKKTPKAKK